MSFHLVPAMSLVTDLLFFSPPYTIAFLPSLVLSFALAFIYWRHDILTGFMTFSLLPTLAIEARPCIVNSNIFTRCLSLPPQALAETFIAQMLKLFPRVWRSGVARKSSILTCDSV
ncbi:hypothetical protein MRB53_039108 [Persea americana]|nr:hypothetical protein MRB53_039108 [Persea americana]